MRRNPLQCRRTSTRTHVLKYSLMIAGIIRQRHCGVFIKSVETVRDFCAKSELG